MKALGEIGIGKTIKFGLFTFLLIIYKLMIFPQLRIIFLRLMGARIGRNVIIHNVEFFNYYRKGFQGLSIGDNSFIGGETMIDLADEIKIEDHVTLAERVVILSHTNVGYKDHPLQKFFPSISKRVVIGMGSFIGVNAVIMPGVSIAEGTFVAAGSVVTEDTKSYNLYGGVPAQLIRGIK